MEELLKIDGFDEAVVGIVFGFGGYQAIAYDYGKCVSILMERDGMTDEEAEEYMDFNVVGAYVGPSTPVFYRPVDDLDELEEIEY